MSKYDNNDRNRHENCAQSQMEAVALSSDYTKNIFSIYELLNMQMSSKKTAELPTCDLDLFIMWLWK